MNNEIKDQINSASFRDPSGFIFNIDGKIYRQINQSYKNDYDLLIKSGLFKELTEKKLLIDHQETNDILPITEECYKIIEPELIPFISYPYEWSFSQLKDSALLTLEIQKIALMRDMTLKDASAYNIQFINGEPIFIDTLSFEKYQLNSPWVAYKQFCQHFLAPLTLMAYTDVRLSNLLKEYIDGIPLDLAKKLLPIKTKFSLGLGLHLHFQANKQVNIKNHVKPSKYRLDKNNLLAIINSLENTIKVLKLPNYKTTWADYYNNTNYNNQAFIHKKKIVKEWLEKLKPNSVWDMGANTGNFSRIASNKEIFTISTDFDPMAIEFSYLEQRTKNDKNLLPLVIDLVNPSPSIGWANHERKSFLERINVDLTMCLALVHHLAIANNLPFSIIAKLLSNHTKKLIIEFVPKEDSNAMLLLLSRDDIFDNYNQENFEKNFSQYFEILAKENIASSQRILYLMVKK